MINMFNKYTVSTIHQRSGIDLQTYSIQTLAADFMYLVASGLLPIEYRKCSIFRLARCGEMSCRFDWTLLSLSAPPTLRPTISTSVLPKNGHSRNQN